MHELLAFHAFFSSVVQCQPNILVFIYLQLFIESYPVRRAAYTFRKALNFTNPRIFRRATIAPCRRIENTFTIHNIVSYNLIYGMDLPPNIFFSPRCTAVWLAALFRDSYCVLRAVCVVCFMAKKKL